MIIIIAVKGIISSVNIKDNTAEIILSEYLDCVTSDIPFYGRKAVDAKIGEAVVLIVFNPQNIADSVII